MDRKIFFSYIQNMQQNNQDMVGFQNSMRKNSWQKPMSLIEQTNSLRDNFENHISDLVHGTEGEPGLYDAYMESLPKGIVPTQITGFHHDPNSAHSGTGFKKIEGGVSLALDAHDALSSLGDRAKGRSYRDLSDVDQERVRDMFVDAMSQRHQAEMMEPDQDEIDMTTDALENQGRYESYNRLNEVKANIRDEYPRTVYSADQDPTASPSGASFDKRKLIGYAAEAALKDENHWIYHPKNHNIRRALFNFTNGNTQTEDLPHIVTFMNQDPKFKKDLEELNADIEKYGHF